MNRISTKHDFFLKRCFLERSTRGKRLALCQLVFAGSAPSKLGEIFNRVQGLIASFLPDELAIEAPFFGKNVQSMLKLGRAQGVAIAAAISRDVPIHEYAPLKIKMAITGNGSASKEQVAEMLRRMLNISADEMPQFMDATDALGAAFCHYIQRGRPVSDKKYSSWTDFAKKNPDKIT